MKTTWMALTLLALGACSSSESPAPAAPPADDAQPDGGAPADSGKPAAKPTFDPLGPEFIQLDEQPAEFTLDVPPSTLGFTLEPLAAVTILKVTDAAGKSYDDPGEQPNRDYRFTRLWRFPANSAEVGLPPGKWTVKLSGPSAFEMARQRTTDGKFHGGALDLYVYIPKGLHAEDSFSKVVPGAVVTAATAEADPAIKALLGTFFQQLKRLLDLDRGDVKFTDIDAKYLTPDTEAEIEEAYHVAERTAGKDLGLHIILTERLFGGGVNGVAPSGSGAFYTRLTNTVLVNLKDTAPRYSNGELVDTAGKGYLPNDVSAYAMIHEAGHLLGLPHTSHESAAPYDDDFSDTPLCPPSTMTTAQKECPDVTNLMFPFTAFPTAKVAISPHQLRVLHGTTVYRPYAPPK